MNGDRSFIVIHQNEICFRDIELDIIVCKIQGSIFPVEENGCYTFQCYRYISVIHLEFKFVRLNTY